jgi:hypothetical protein
MAFAYIALSIGLITAMVGVSLRLVRMEQPRRRQRVPRLIGLAGAAITFVALVMIVIGMTR